MEHIVRNHKIPSTDKRLNRHVYHDARSRNFAFDTSKLSIVSVFHGRHIPILDQGNVGSCTGNAGIGALATDPVYSTSISNNTTYPLTEDGAVKLYSDAEMIDGTGPYPPNDYGSYGLSIAKALKNAGLISSYQHTFTLDDALKALTQYPIMVGINWYNSMFNPQADGRVTISGGIAGGHEIVARQIDARNQRVWFDNSWGTSWGVNGRFYLTFTDLGRLLSEQGDVIVLIPNGVAPATTTTTTIKPNTTTTTTIAPPSQEDVVLAEAMRTWLTAKGL